MPMHCCAYGCNNRHGPETKMRGISFHSFPSDAALCEQWAVKIRRVDEQGRLWRPGKTSVICSQHFQQDAFSYQFGRKTVKSGALPTVFSFAPPVPKRKAPKCRREAAVFEPETPSIPEAVSTPESTASVSHMNTSDTESIHSNNVQIFHSYCIKSPKKLRRENEILRKRLISKVGALRNARKREVRLKRKVASLLEELKQKRLLTDQAADLLEAYRELPLHVFQRRRDGLAFGMEQRQFASTLHYYSPSAYSYVRSKIPSLPNPRTIRRWLASFDGQPGLTEESFNKIRTANDRPDKSTAYRICALTIDEMEIKKQVDTDRQGKVHGFQDIGCGAMDSDDQPQATKALVVLALGLNAHWKLPLAYLLTNGASADLQVTLLTDVLTKLWDSGCVAVSVTFDGLLANQKTLIKLGGSLDADNIVARFQHPCDPTVNVVVMFDACHMMKLARNLLKEYQILTVDGIAQAKWKHLEMLNEIQQQEGLTLANKITDRHINYKTQKMKVKLAVQLLSSSSVTALEYLRTSNYPGFEDTFGTEMFLSHLDRLFDILNSRSAFAKGFKAPISASNVAAKLSALTETRNFLLTLCDSNGKKLTETKRRTCIIGFLATIDSAVYLIGTLLTSRIGINGVRLQYMLTHKFSQDHVEMFFSTIRRRGGWNNNPTALQFISAYRAILSRVGALPSDNGNVTVSARELNVDDVISFVAHEWLPMEGYSSSSTQDTAVDVEGVYCAEISLHTLSSFVENICTYISGFVVRRLLRKVRCCDCRALLIGSAETSDCMLLRLKDNGGLITPSAAVVSIIEQIERKIRLLVASDTPAHSISQLGLQLESSVLADVEPSKLFDNSSHALETADLIDNHVFSLVRLIARQYLDIRKHHILRNWNIKQQGKVIRQTLNKTVLFRNQ